MIDGIYITTHVVQLKYFLKTKMKLMLYRFLGHEQLSVGTLSEQTPVYIVITHASIEGGGVRRKLFLLYEVYFTFFSN